MTGDTGPQGEPGEPAGPLPWLTADRVDIAVTALTFDASGAHVAFTLKDRDGKPLDRTGFLTEGKVTVSFVLAQLGVNSDGSSAQYTAYTRKWYQQASPNHAIESKREDLHCYNFLATPGTASSKGHLMAELKTIPTRASVDKFLKGIQDERQREDCYRILDMMKRAARAEPRMWGTSIIGFGKYRSGNGSGRACDGS